MNIKKNFFFNSILLVSQYIFPMLVFPYITRVFGPSTLGIVSFVDSVTDYFVLFSALGVSLTGLRAVAKYKNDKEKLSKVFTELLLLHLISTLIFIVIYLILIFTVAKMQQHYELFFISISKLLFNVFLIEWFYRGIEDFKFITIRTILIRGLYVCAIYLFVRTKDDYLFYYVSICLMTVFNAIVNISYIRGKASVTFRGLNIKQHLKPYFTVGLYLIVTSMYTTFNISFLGFVSSSASVGYYATSSKLFSMIFGFFQALNTVLMPRLSSVFMKDNNELEFRKIIDKSFNFVLTFCFPIIMCSLILAKPIIMAAAGHKFNGAIICFRLIIPLVFILGIAQIFANQILMTIKKDTELLIAALVGGGIGLSLNFILVPVYHEVGTSLVLLISELVVAIILMYFTIKHTSFRMPYLFLAKNFIFSLPYLLIGYVAMRLFANSILVLMFAVAVSALYFLTIQLFILKNQLLVPYYFNIKSFIYKTKRYYIPIKQVND